jgi:tRNA(Ile)-lysidine synthase
MNLATQFDQYYKQEFGDSIPPNTTLLLAVSGGIDSVVLVDLCDKTGIDFAIAHCNFQLRGAESTRDELFVQQLSEKYGKAIFIQRFETAAFAEANQISIQVAARQLRYKWFDELVQSHPNLTAICTAHHADDNIETVMMNIFRGTGMAGLHGILPKHGKIIRPLLFAKRREIEQYALAHQLSWVEDSSNDLDKYTRNFFRHQIIPLVQQVYPQATNNLLDNIIRWTEMEVVYNEAIGRIKKKLIAQKENEIHIPVLQWKKTEPLQTITYELIKDFGFTTNQTVEVIKLLDAATGSFIASSTHRIIKNRNWIIIAPIEQLLAQSIIIEAGVDTISFGGSVMRIVHKENIATNLSASNAVAMIDAGQLQFPLLLRKWKQGDYFYPLGMQKKKKLSKFLIDQKKSKTDKENVWVLASNQKIVWVVGHRIDDRFKITATTKKILLFTIER